MINLKAPVIGNVHTVDPLASDISGGRTVVIGGGGLVVLQCGTTGATGDAGVMSASEVVTIVKQTIHTDANNEGVFVDASGNIRLTLGTLPSLP